MCGITGFLSPSIDSNAAVTLRAMIDRLVHRGPDDSGVWLDEESGVALGHRRLSILDLSPAGQQPMFSPSGRYVLVFNGEIYNHHDLRRALESDGIAPKWSGHSDTEVLAAGIERWGFEGALKRSNGMFAIAVWDRRERLLYLGRDRIGEKPLYYGLHGNAFLFGSELKAITAHPGFDREINREAVALFLRHNYVPTPLSIWKGIYKLPPAHYLVVKSDAHVGTPICYWDFEKVALESRHPRKAEADAMVQELDELLRDAVACRMEADVPLGAFLSGGIDSSLIVAIMQRQSERRIRTFSIGFEEKEYDESGYAKAVAAHLGTDHTELYVSFRDALEVIPLLPTIWDEPFSDSSQIPTYLLCALTREHVKVALSGDGGDELFGGYERYVRAAKLWALSGKLPAGVRSVAAALLGSAAAASAGAQIDSYLPSGSTLALGHRLPLFGALLRQREQQCFYRHFVSHWKEPTSVMADGNNGTGASPASAPRFRDFYDTMMYADTIAYLPDDILTKVDRASMAVSLEARVPFLDHRLVEFAWRLPLSAKIRNGTGKWILREVLAKYVPPHLIERPKMGFAVPIDHWLRGPLREWAEDLLDEQRLREDGFFRPEPIRKKWIEHLKGRGQWHFYLWDVLVFQAWWRYQQNSASARRA